MTARMPHPNVGDPMRRVDVFAYVIDAAMDGGRRHFGAAVPVPGDWWILLCKDAVCGRPN